MDEILSPEVPQPEPLTIRALRARCQSTAPAPERETFTGKRARFFSIYLTRLFLLTSITPNQITFLSVLVFFCGVGAFLLQQQTWAIVGACLVFFATVLDGCDGEVSRFRKLNSTVGALYSEPVSHDIQYGFMFIPLGLAATLERGTIWPLFFAFLAGSFKSVARLIESRHWTLLHSNITQEEIKVLRQAYKDRPWYLRLISWTKRNIWTSNGLILPLLLAAIFDRLDWYVYFYGVTFALLWALIFARQLMTLPKVTVQTDVKSVPGSSE